MKRKLPRKYFSKIWVYLARLTSFMEILENTVPFATGSCRKFKADILVEWKAPNEKINRPSSSKFQNTMTIYHFRNDKGTGAEMRPAIVSGMVTGDAPASYWSIFLPVPSNCPRGLCEI